MKNKSLKLNAMLNGVKQCCSVIFPLITFPYISRVLQAENYGKYSFSYSIVSYFALIAALGISKYAIREGAIRRNNPEEIKLFASQIFTINLITTVFAYILLFMTVFFVKNLQDYNSLIIILSSTIIFTTIGVDWINTIYEDYLYITVRYIIFQIISLIALFVFVKSKEDYLIYAFITVFANGGANILNYIHTRKYVKVSIVRALEMHVHIKPMLILFANNLAITVYINTDIVLLGVFQNDMVVGVYSIATKIYIIAKNLINAVITVMVPRLSLYLGEKRHEEYHYLLNKLFSTLIILIMPVVTGMFMMSNNIIYIVGGEQYIMGTTSLKILSIALAFAVMSSFFTNAVLLPNKLESKFLISTVTAAMVNLMLNFITIPLFSLNGAAITTVIAEVTVLIMSIYYCKDKFILNAVFRQILSCAVGCVFIVVCCLLVQLIISNIWWETIISVISSSLIYITFLLCIKNEIVIELLKPFMKLFSRRAL